MDRLSSEERSAHMRKVRRQGTAPELRVRRVAHGLGLRFRLHRKDLPGTPDLVFPRHRTAIFVHGCFWHGHEDCKFATVPKTRTNWWLAKIDANRARDRRAVDGLAAKGWRAEIVWECETRDAGAVRARLGRLFGTRVDVPSRVEEHSESEDRRAP
ncbi:very short patch repair endonuclease [Phenylobacterium sp.]|uniref:very short patch repair endonuclease n=1 Tax=Phenylobacterium sp. TaxID=1871053 RepID=UPI002FCC74A7